MGFCLILEKSGGGPPLFIEPLPEREFAISYRHSVNKSLIRDRFRADENGTIFLKSSLFHSFGAGVATWPGERGVFEGKGEALEYRDIDLPLPDFRLFIGTVADHKLSVPSGDYPLDELAPPQTGIRITCRRLSAFQAVSWAIMKGVLHGRSKNPKR